MIDGAHRIDLSEVVPEVLLAKAGLVGTMVDERTAQIIEKLMMALVEES